MRVQDGFRLIALAAIWGGSFVFMRVLAPVLGPVVTTDLRVLIAGLVLLLYFKVIRFNADWGKNWKHYLIIGAANAGLPFVLFSFAALHIPASYSAILNSTTPFFAAVFSSLWLRDKLTRRKLFGMLVGALGVACITGIQAVQFNFAVALSILACLTAAICYGLSGVYVKKFANHIQPLAIAGGSQLGAGLLLLPLVPFSPIRGEITAPLVVMLFCFSFFCSAIAFILYFRLLADIGLTKALTIPFLIPIFGIIWGVLFLNEVLSFHVIAGMVLIITGIYFVMKK